MSEPVTRFVVGPREHGRRLDHFLHEKIPGLSRQRIQRAIRERIVLSWTAPARAATPVRAGGIVRIAYRPLAEPPLDLELSVLERHPGWLVVDKPSGIPVHPVNRVRENSLIRLLRRQEGCESLRLAHRLDRETSGVLLIADNPETARQLSVEFLHCRVQKEYLALVSGVVNEDHGSIDEPIGRDEDSPIFVRQRAGTGRAARTDWRVAGRGADRTLLSVFPHTGRRHQIRVHLATLGHPVLGDILYGRPPEAYLDLVRGAGDVREREGTLLRQMLHCARLKFTDPGGEGDRTVTAPLPADFLAQATVTPLPSTSCTNLPG